MTKQLPSILSKLFLCLFFVAFVASASATQAADLKLDLQLIWGTNDPQSSDPKHKPVEPALAKKMGKSPFKWKNYFEISRKQIAVAPNATQKATMSEHCTVQVKNLGDGRIEVTLIGKGKTVRKDTHVLKNGMFVIGGDVANNDTSWFVVVNEAK